MESLRNLTALKKLGLNNCEEITDIGMKFLENFLHLTSLNISVCNLTDTGLESLKVLPALTEVDYEYCEELTSEGMDALDDYLNQQIRKNM